MSAIQKHPSVVERTARWTVPDTEGPTSGAVPDMVGRTTARHGVRFRPRTVVCLWRQVGDGQASVAVNVNGPIVKSDGTASVGQAYAEFLGHASLASMPQWLAQLVIEDMTLQVTVAPGRPSNLSGYHRP